MLNGKHGLVNEFAVGKRYNSTFEQRIGYLDRVDQTKYLLRIGVDSEVNADEATLNRLQRQHLLNVPFENLDIHWGRPITLDTSGFYEKIVDERRGGFCYELNGLFNELLRTIGFKTKLVSARVFDGNGFGPEFDHAAVIVTIGELEYVADVGFGEFTAETLRLIAGIEHKDREGDFVVRPREFGVLEVAKRTADSWTPEYIFEPLERDLSEFSGMCEFHQSSPNSHFTKGKVCSILTGEGRKTLTDKKFIVTSKGEKTERSVGSDEEFDAILLKEFNISRNI